MTDGTTERLKFEFGRHETFPVRYGWLGKGLERMAGSDAGFRADDDAVVELGLGTRMVKSLRYWLEASGLGEAGPGGGGHKARPLIPSPFGLAVRERDPFLEYPATWWFVHLHLARRSGSVWGWFFGAFRERGFDRAACVEAYRRYLRLHAAGEPTLGVAQRDIACLLLAYAADAGGGGQDPEDGTSSPLRELGLIVRHTDTGAYERTRPPDGVPAEAFLACVAAAAADRDQQALSVSEMLGRSSGPGRVFGLDADTLEDMCVSASRDFAASGVTLDLLGSERRLRVPDLGAAAWLDRHFQRIGGRV